MPELAVSRDKVSFLIEKAHEFDVKDLPADEESGSNPIDDAEVDVLQDDGSDSVADEMANFIRSLNEDEQIDLVALMWLGRGDGTLEDWLDLRDEADNQHNKRTAAYLLVAEFLSDLTEYWQVIFGPILVAVVVFGRGGLVGLFGVMRRRGRD